MVNYWTDIESKLKRIEEDPEGSGTSHLFTCMQGVSSLANRAFEPLFERQVGKIQPLDKLASSYLQYVSNSLIISLNNIYVGSSWED